MTLKICANISLLFTDRPLPERIIAAKAAGFDGVEIQFPYATDIETLAVALQRSQLPLVAINLPADDLMQGGEGLAAVPAKVDQFRAALSQGLRYARRLKAAHVNVLPGRCRTGDTGRYRQQLIDNLRCAGDYFGRHDIRVMVEPLSRLAFDHALLHDLASCERILTHVAHPNVFIQYDIYHMAAEQQALEAQLTHCAKHRIAHIQFADFPNRHQPGHGGIDWPTLLRAISKSGYEHWLSAEYYPAPAPAPAPASETTATAAAESHLNWLHHFRQILGESHDLTC